MLELGFTNLSCHESQPITGGESLSRLAAPMGCARRHLRLLSHASPLGGLNGSQIQGGVWLGLGVQDSEFLGLSLSTPPNLMTDEDPGVVRRSWWPCLDSELIFKRQFSWNQVPGGSVCSEMVLKGSSVQGQCPRFTVS